MSSPLNPQRIAQIRSTLQSRETEDLLEIWRANDTDEWSPEAFEAIRIILTERLGAVPSRVESDAERLVRAERILERVNRYLERGEFGQALAGCNRAIQLAPQLAVAHNYRGLALDTLERLPEAIEAYRKAVRLDPQFADAQENLRQAESEWAEGAGAELATISEAEDEMEAEQEEAVAGFVDEGGNIPEEFYLSETARIVPGWPGHRNRPGRSGLDPLETRFEFAHMEGRFLRLLFTGKLRIKNQILLVLAGLFAVLLIMPLILGGAELLKGNHEGLYILIEWSLYGIPGLALLWNVILSVRDHFLETENDES